MTEPNAFIEFTHSYGQWFSPLAIFVSAGVAILLGRYAANKNKEIARKRATLDVILQSESDGYFERIYTVFASEKQRKAGLVALFNSETDSEKKAKLEVDNFLNHYELIAISIESEILDEEFYKKWMKSTYIKHYQESLEYICRTRRDNPKAYIAFEALAKKWEQEKN